MNTQPYKVIVVHTPEDKKKLGKLMLLNNERFVNTASATLIVCCDLGAAICGVSCIEPEKDLHKLTELEMENGVPESIASNAEKYRK